MIDEILEDVDRSDIPGVSAVFAVGASIADLVLFGGDVIVSLLFTLIQSADLWVGIVGYLLRVRSWGLEIVPAGALEQLLVIGTLILLTFYVLRFIDRLTDVLDI